MVIALECHAKANNTEIKMTFKQVKVEGKLNGTCYPFKTRIKSKTNESFVHGYLWRVPFKKIIEITSYNVTERRNTKQIELNSIIADNMIIQLRNFGINFKFCNTIDLIFAEMKQKKKINIIQRIFNILTFRRHKNF